MSGRRIIIVDDHPLFRAALRQTLSGAAGDMVIEEAGNLDELNAALARDRDCDLVLLDLNMPGARGFAGLLLLRAQYPDVPVLIVSAVDDGAVVRRAFQLGASGYLGKSAAAADISGAIDTVLAGELFVPSDMPVATDAEADLMKRLASLTPQQVRVLMMLKDGLMNKQIAYELDISEATVKAHVSAILQKLDVDSRTQAVIAAGRIEAGQFDALVSAAGLSD